MMRRTPILMYHRVPADAAQRAEMAVIRDDFAAQMALLAARGIAVLTLADFLALLRRGRSPARPSVVLTFDDGYAATCANVEAILAQYRFRATLFLTTGLIGKPDPLDSRDEGKLGWAQLRALRQFDIAAHTVTHPRLSRLPQDALRREVRDCREVIAQHLGGQVDLFAYPFGAYDRRVVAAVREAGYAAACAVHRGPSGPGDDPLRLHRVGIDGRDSPEVFERKVTSGFGSRRDALASLLRDRLFAVPGLHDALERRRNARRPH